MEAAHPTTQLPASGARPEGRAARRARMARIKRAARQVVGKDFYERARAMYHVARGEELRAPFPLSYKLHWWSRGFKADSARVYDFPVNDYREYVSDYMRDARNIAINSSKPFFDNKPLFRSFLLAKGFPQAQTVALVNRRGEVIMHPFDERVVPATVEQLERWMLEDGGTFFVKPENGSFGAGIFLLQAQGGALVQRRGRDARPFQFGLWMRQPVIVERALEQGAFFRNLHPASSNTMRVLTMWTPGESEPFIAWAVQRMGTADTVPTDNFSGGGVSSLIDLETGRLGIGRIHPAKGKREHRTYARHPDTGAQIEGELVPHWHRVREVALRAAKALPTNPYVGWDILVDEAGEAIIIEGNGNSGFGAMQVHGGLLSNPAARRFYQRCGAL